MKKRHWKRLETALMREILHAQDNDNVKDERLLRELSADLLRAVEQKYALQKAATLALSVLQGCVPGGNYSGQRRKRQFDRIDEAIVALAAALSPAQDGATTSAPQQIQEGPEGKMTSAKPTTFGTPSK